MLRPRKRFGFDRFNVILHARSHTDCAALAFAIQVLKKIAHKSWPAAKTDAQRIKDDEHLPITLHASADANGRNRQRRRNFRRNIAGNAFQY